MDTRMGESGYTLACTLHSNVWFVCLQAFAEFLGARFPSLGPQPAEVECGDRSRLSKLAETACPHVMISLFSTMCVCVV